MPKTPKEPGKLSSQTSPSAARHTARPASAISQQNEGSVQFVRVNKNTVDRLMNRERQRRARILQRVPQWLYTECVLALHPGLTKASYNSMEDTDLWFLNSDDGWKRMEEMAKSDFPLHYPPRPSTSSSLPESASVREFKDMMLTFPKIKFSKEGFPEGVLEGKEHVRWDGDGWEQTEFYVLTEEYENTIKQHLRTIERDHGKEVRAIANWEVRDKYAENIQGVEWYEGNYPPARFLDHSDYWLKS